MTSFLLLTFLQILLFVFFLVKFPRREEIDRFLLIMSIGGSLAILSKVFFHRINPGHDLQHTISSTLCFCSMSYLFIKEFLSEQKINRKEIVLHLIPFLISIVFSLYELAKIYLDAQLFHGFNPLILAIENNIRFLGLVAYLLLDIDLYRQHRGAFKKQYRSINGGLAIYFFIHKVLLLLLIVITTYVVKDMNPFILFFGLISMPVLVFVAMYYKVFLSLKKITTELNEKLKDYLSLAANQKEKYAKAKVNDQKVENYSQRIKSYLEKERPYLNPDFSMDDFANAMQLSNHDLSLVFNKMETSFYQLVNQHRTEYFLEHLQDILSSKKSILTLAYESGFNSKSTFNKYFKLTLGVSPSEHIKKQQAKSIPPIQSISSLPS